MNNIIVTFSLFKNKILQKMKKQLLILGVLGILLASCLGGQLNPQYVYNTNPSYTWAYAEFYGPYYKSENGNLNNVISLSLFSDSLEINKIGNLVGTGQYLFLEDVFVAKTDTFLPEGTYTINDSGLAFSVAPGKNDTVDNQVYPIGANISYYEGNTAMSTQKLVTGGNFTVSRTLEHYSIIFNLKTSDKKDLKGTFTAVLPHINQSVVSLKNSARKRLIYAQN
jgi:hypothetical protein